jgi:hypothetical protein
MIFEGIISHKILLFDITPYIESLWIIFNVIQYEPFYFNGTKNLTMKIFIPNIYTIELCYKITIVTELDAKKMTSLCSWESCKIKI